MKLERKLAETVGMVEEAIGLDFLNGRREGPDSVRFDLETPEGFKVAEVVMSRFHPKGPWKLGAVSDRLFTNLDEVIKVATAS